VNRIRATLTAALAIAGFTVITAAGSAHSSVATVSRAPTVRLAQTSAGKILVDGSGFTLYTFTRDKRKRDACIKIPGCLSVWPAVTTTRRPTAGSGVRSSLLGAIPLHGNVKQVTYAGHPLYTYAHDFAPYTTLNIGSYEYGGFWNAVKANGQAIN
jgi:predicted lipoprotein with Yx(FWY)xxD motif